MRNPKTLNNTLANPQPQKVKNIKMPPRESVKKQILCKWLRQLKLHRLYVHIFLILPLSIA
jgi:hypothetical protein